jgi:hypothetical protein
MLNLLFQSGSAPVLTPIDQAIANSEMLISALMMHATLKDDLTEMEREGYTLLSVALIEPATA